MIVGTLQAPALAQPGDVGLAIGAAVDGEIAAASGPGEPGVG